MAKKLNYNKWDFEVLEGEQTGDSRIAYVFNSKDGEVTANFFWIEGNVEVRGMVGKTGILHLQMPFANPVGNPQPLPKANDVLAPIIRKLAKGEY